MVVHELLRWPTPLELSYQPEKRQASVQHEGDRTEGIECVSTTLGLAAVSGEKKRDRQRHTAEDGGGTAQLILPIVRECESEAAYKLFREIFHHKEGFAHNRSEKAPAPGSTSFHAAGSGPHELLDLGEWLIVFKMVDRSAYRKANSSFCALSGRRDY